MLSTSLVLPILSLAAAALAGPLHNRYGGYGGYAPVAASATGSATSAAQTGSAAASGSSSSSSSSSGSADATGVEHTGAITYYNTAGGKGACGQPLQDSEAICALSTTLYDQYTTGGNPNDNSLCGKKIQITMGDGSTAEVTVADRCEACAEWDLDLTPTTFQSIVTGGLDEGRTTASWVFVD